MKKIIIPLIFGLVFSLPILLWAQDGLIDQFDLPANDLELTRLAKPGTPFGKVGHKFAILGEESGSFEAWAYPLKLFRNFEFSFFLGSSTRPLPARDLVQSIAVTPEATVLTYTYQTFTIRSIYVTPVEEPAALIFLQVQSTEPLKIVCSFLPVLQPMWPAGIGGQYARWMDEQKAYLISEPTRKNQGLLGCPFAVGISSTPAHMLSDVPNEFLIEIKEPTKVKDKFIPIYIIGGKMSRDSLFAAYKKLQQNPAEYYFKNAEYYQNLRKNTLQITTPDRDLDLSFEWAKVAYDNLLAENPDLGKGLLAGLHASGTSGRPGFGWYFGGDAYMNILSLNSYGYFTAVKDALAFTQKWQREDGKMAHELSQAAGYINWWKDYPYGFIHADTTPFYIVAMSDYFRMTGDNSFIKNSWNSLQKAYQWCLSTDENGDGLMDNKKAGLGASEYGALTGIETDVYLAAVWVKAAQEMQALAAVAGDKKLRDKAKQDYQKALDAFQKKFWYQEGGFYAYAFNANGKHVTEISPWLSVGLLWNLGTPDQTNQSLQKLNSADMTTDWGVRLISNKSTYYNPVGYNYGAVWPFVTGWVTLAQYRHHFSQQGFQLLKSNAQHTFTDHLGMMPEVLSGAFNIPLEESVSQQGFSSGGVVLPLVRGLFGLQGDVSEKVIEFKPQFPADWKQVGIRNYQLGDARFDIDFQRSGEQIKCTVKSENADGYKMIFSPVLGKGTEVLSLTLNGDELKFDIQDYLQNMAISAEISMIVPEMVIEMKIEPALELLPVIPVSHTGDSNQGLKILSIHSSVEKTAVNVEGLSGETYFMPVLNSDKIKKLEGAVLEQDRIIITIPTSPDNEFMNHNFTIFTQ
ncbi:MAG: hypothetical protein A2Y94_12705 [Caldithrix sp. RBG_13_44_9]|nr:MAG: hypothetical protein A2Y94_12705 [Caldithrix sp. RBG_13_44_9]